MFLVFFSSCILISSTLKNHNYNHSVILIEFLKQLGLKFCLLKFQRNFHTCINSIQIYLSQHLDYSNGKKSLDALLNIHEVPSRCFKMQSHFGRYLNSQNYFCLLLVFFYYARVLKH